VLAVGEEWERKRARSVQEWCLRDYVPVLEPKQVCRWTGLWALGDSLDWFSNRGFGSIHLLLIRDTLESQKPWMVAQM